MHRLPRYQISLVRDGSIPYNSPQYPRFANSRDLFNHLRPMMQAIDREVFVIVALDSKNRMIGFHPVAIGSLTTSVVHPREVFKPLVLQNAAAFIAIHNHPSGDPAPSREDRLTTDRMARGSETLGIRLLDHVIIGDQDYFSFADAGQLKEVAEPVPV